MSKTTKTEAFEPCGVAIAKRSSRLLAKLALVVEEDAARWAVYVVTGTPKGSDFWPACVEKTERLARQRARDMMDGRWWPKQTAACEGPPHDDCEPPEPVEPRTSVCRFCETEFVGSYDEDDCGGCRLSVAQCVEYVDAKRAVRS